MARRALSPAQLALVRAVRVGLAAPEPARPWSVRVACSGGADSLALAAALAWCDRHEPDPLRQATAMVVDHGLQDGSAEVAARTTAVLAGLGLPAASVRVEIDPHAPGGLEAAARQARYAALARPGAAVVLLGHTLDDQAETVLLGLARGSGTRSLAGMAPSFRWAAGDGSRPPARTTGDGSAASADPTPWSPLFRRPLLGLRRRLTAQACRDWGLRPWDDPMNTDAVFARVRARRLVPALEEALGPGVAEALARTAVLARQDADYLDELARRALDPPAAGNLALAWLRQLPPALRGRVVRTWLTDAGLPAPEYVHVQAIMALVSDWHGQRGVDLPGGTVVRDGDHLVVAADHYDGGHGGC